MRNRRLHQTIVGGITGIALFSVAGAWLLTSRTSLFLAFVCACFVVLLAGMLIRKTEKTNRQLESFFDAVRNNDYNVHFNANTNDTFLNGLFQEMNRIMTHFEENQSKLEEKRLYYESIVKVLTHEIRNSITPISSLSADLIKHTDEYGKEGVINGLQTINQQAQQLSSFLNAYHRLTHLPDPVKTKVNIQDLFDKLDHLLRSEQGSRNIRYSSPGNMKIVLDQHLVTLALINLIRNALQATIGHPEPHIRVEAGEEAGYSFIQVTDNGEGVPQNRAEEVFIPFYSTRNEGSGIGLPLSQRIMQLHGGRLVVNPEPATTTNTVFRMLFPRHCLSAIYTPPIMQNAPANEITDNVSDKKAADVRSVTNGTI